MSEPRGLTRRQLLIGAAIGATTVAAAGAGIGIALTPRRPEHQPGVASPATPQRQALVTGADLPPSVLADRDALRDALAKLGRAAAGHPATVLLGLGPAVLAAIDPRLPGSGGLPSFASDRLEPGRSDGDLLVGVYADGEADLEPSSVLDAVGATVRWQQRAFRGPGEGLVVVNPVGFRDGIIVPHTEAELDADVWREDGSTVCVIRRIRLDIAGFEALPLADQESLIGRTKATGAPLSGGGPDAPVDLNAKSPDGQYLIPVGSHVRAAHPAFTGSGLMLRRGYAFDDGPQDAGLLFTCFQRELDTFVATQHRIDEQDAFLGGFGTTTGSAVFLIPNASEPFASTLFA